MATPTWPKRQNYLEVAGSIPGQNIFGSRKKFWRENKYIIIRFPNSKIWMMNLWDGQTKRVKIRCLSDTAKAFLRMVQWKMVFLRSDTRYMLCYSCDNLRPLNCLRHSHNEKGLASLPIIIFYVLSFSSLLCWEYWTFISLHTTSPSDVRDLIVIVGIYSYSR